MFEPTWSWLLASKQTPTPFTVILVLVTFLIPKKTESSKVPIEKYKLSKIFCANKSTATTHSCVVGIITKRKYQTLSVQA